MRQDNLSNWTAKTTKIREEEAQQFGQNQRKSDEGRARDGGYSYFTVQHVSQIDLALAIHEFRYLAINAVLRLERK